MSTDDAPAGLDRTAGEPPAPDVDIVYMVAENGEEWVVYHPDIDGHADEWAQTDTLLELQDQL